MEGRVHRSWLWTNRVKIALGIAIFEGLVVAFEKDFSRITVIVIAVPIILFYLLAGRSVDSQLGREVSWVLAASQAFAVVAVIVLTVTNLLGIMLGKWTQNVLTTAKVLGIGGIIVSGLLWARSPREYVAGQVARSTAEQLVSGYLTEDLHRHARRPQANPDSGPGSP